MSQAPIDFTPYVRRCFPLPWPSPLTPVSISQEGTTLTVVFDGRTDLRAGRFGVHVTTPERVGDARWRDFFGEEEDEDDPAEWAKMAVILEVEEIYDTTALESTAEPDADGIIWLS